MEAINNSLAKAKVSDLDGSAPDSTDFANYFCAYAYIYHQARSKPQCAVFCAIDTVLWSCLSLLCSLSNSTAVAWLLHSAGVFPHAALGARLPVLTRKMCRKTCLKIISGRVLIIRRY